MARSIRIADFDTWQPGYSNAIVTVYVAGTTTLAALYQNPDLTGAIANPQTLGSRVDGSGQAYGKWQQPVYIGQSYELSISTGERTGVERVPLFDLDGADASAAVVTPTGGTTARSLQDLMGDAVRIENYGTLGVSANTNTSMLAAAIGQAAGQGGGPVLLPAGTIEFTAISIPQGVFLCGEGRAITTLRSTQGQRIVTIAGDRAGLVGLTLDGVNLTPGSVAVYAVGRTEPVLESVEIKRFATGLQMKGATRPRFRDLFLSNCTTGGDLRGDTDEGTTNLGTALRTLTWDGGKVDLCSTAGLILSYENAVAQGIHLRGIDFDSNSGTGLVVNGARGVTLSGGRFSGNTKNIALVDDSDASRSADNTIRSFHADQVAFSGGEVTFDGTCDDVAFDRCDFTDVDFVLSIPKSPILLIDCHEDAATTATGATEKLQRSSRSGRGDFAGVTTDGNYITAWSLVLDPGEIVHLKARALGRQRNGTDRTSRELSAVAYRAPADLTFDLASGTVTVGSIVTGATSGASARIVANSQTGTAGTLSLRDIVGTFEVGETLNTSSGETAKCTSPLSSPSTTVTGVADIGTPYESDATWDVTVDASTSQVRVKVRGATSKTVEWAVQIDVMRP